MHEILTKTLLSMLGSMVSNYSLLDFLEGTKTIPCIVKHRLECEQESLQGLQ